MTISKDDILDVLKTVHYPGFTRDIVSFGLVKSVDISDAGIKVRIELTTADNTIPKRLNDAVRAAFEADGRSEEVEVELTVHSPKNAAAASSGSKPEALADVKHIIAVASGKGGVGKSTFAVNLACAFDLLLRSENSGANGVGIMDCDIYGPSTPTLLGLHDRPEVEGNAINPLSNFGISMMSMGLLVDEDTPVVWRGPMVNKAIQQFASQVNWGKLDCLIVDLPPGTGDAQLTLTQTIPLDGAVIVTTPQKLACDVTQRGAMMFAKVNVPILGVAENMAYLEDSKTGERSYIFGEGGGNTTAQFLETRLLGQVPLDETLRKGADQGIPIVKSHPEHPASKAFIEIARQLLERLQSAA